MESQAIVYVSWFFFWLSRQFPMCSSFFNNSVNYIWSMAAKFKANHTQINQENGQLGGNSWQSQASA